MKKFLLLTLLSCSIIFTAMSQISIKNIEGELIEGEQNGVEHEPYNFLISNNGTSDIEIVMTVTKIVFPEGAKSIQVCGNGTCLPFLNSTEEETQVGSMYVTIPAGATSEAKDDFHVEYDNGDITAEASASIKFYEKDNEINFATVDIVFFKGKNSVNDMNKSKFISLYPNPAKEYIYLRYDNINSGELVIRNIVGKEVKKVEINSGENNKKVSISDLQEGVYLYSIIENGETVISKKLVINR